EGSGTPSEPHHTPFPEAKTSHPTTSSIPLLSIPTVPIPSITQPVTTPIIQYLRRARIAQSFALPTIVDEPASPVRDVSEGEACPTKSGFIADQDRATIVKSSTLPHDSAPRVTSPATDEGKLISDLVKYQDNYSKVYKFQSQQRRPMTKKQKKEYYMAAIKSNLGWRFKDFKDLLKQLDREDLSQLWALVKEYLSIRLAINDKEMKLWVELRRMYEPDPKDQLRSIKFRGGLLGIKCTRHSHCQVKCSHWQYKFPLPVKVVATAKRLEMPLPEVWTAIEEKKKKLLVKDRWQLH
nr:hypothetical protein [Tanacetum cinerariifolium]